jgi:membrane protein DedA with SNARE-associated domain
MGLPLPGEVVLLTAGALAAQNNFGIVGVAMAAWIGTIAGGSGGYWIGRTGGMAFITRYGRWLGINEKREKKVHAYFDKHGAWTIIAARFVAILRMLAGIVAGSVEMPFSVFTLCNAIGGLVWSIVFAALGYLFGEQMHRLERYLRGGTLLALLAALLVGAGFWLYRKHRRANNQKVAS